jgi:choice-of-anchor B domain-containing protein
MKFLFSFISFFMLGMLNAQISKNIALQSNQNGMPSGRYNDVWGYVDEQGNEYAIIGSRSAINIWNVTDCANPQLVLSHLDGITSIWRDFKSYGHYVYGVADHNGAGGVYVIDMSTNPPTVNTYNNHFIRAHNIFIDVPNHRLYVVGSNTVNRGFIIYDLENTPENPEHIKSVQLDTLLGVNFNTYIHDVYVKDHIAYASTNYNGYYIYDVSDVDNIQLLGSNDVHTSYNHSSWTHPFDEDVMYVAYEVPLGIPLKIFQKIGEDIAFINEFNDPLEAPQFTNNVPHNPFVRGDSLYISYYHDGLKVYDVSDALHPRLVGWYDTYPDNNGQGYSGYEGMWGTYPFLPSGCIICADINYGLFTFKMIQRANFIEEGSLYFSSPGSGLILLNERNEEFLLNIDISGNPVVVPVTTEEASAEIDWSDICIDQSSDHWPVFTSESNHIFKLEFDQNSNLRSFQLSTPPDSSVRVQSGNIKLSHRRRGLVIKIAEGNCRRIAVDTNGSLYHTPVDCPVKE